MTPGDPFDELAGDSDLEAAAGAAREDRRAEEDQYAHAAARQWARHRDLLDITRELQHRGDTVAMQVGDSSFRGVIDAVGADYVQLRTPAGRVDIALVVSHERTPVPSNAPVKADGGPSRWHALFGRASSNTTARRSTPSSVLRSCAKPYGAASRSGATMSPCTTPTGATRISRWITSHGRTPGGSRTG